MTTEIDKYNEDGTKIIGTEKVKVYGLVRYLGDSCASFENGKTYCVVGIEGVILRVVDEDDAYLYSFSNPTINFKNNKGEPINGRFEVVDDFTKNGALKALETDKIPSTRIGIGLDQIV